MSFTCQPDITGSPSTVLIGVRAYEMGLEVKPGPDDRKAGNKDRSRNHGLKRLKTGMR